ATRTWASTPALPEARIGARFTTRRRSGVRPPGGERSADGLERAEAAAGIERLARVPRTARGEPDTEPRPGGPSRVSPRPAGGAGVQAVGPANGLPDAGDRVDQAVLPPPLGDRAGRDDEGCLRIDPVQSPVSASVSIPRRPVDSRQEQGDAGAASAELGGHR